QRERCGTDWHPLCLGGPRVGMAYADELERSHPGRVQLWPSADLGRHDLDSVWRDLPRGGLVYACGPESLLTALEEAARGHGAEDLLVVERFAPRPVAKGPNRSFEVQLKRRAPHVTPGEGR